MLRFILAALCLWFLASPAQAGKRVALVIGNNTYENVPVLQKAVNDAQSIAQELARLGFEVVSAENVGRRAMSRALVELEGKVEAGDTALIYFAGHGFAVDGTNYLLPVDVPVAGPGEEGLVRDASFAAGALSERLQEKGVSYLFAGRRAGSLDLALALEKLGTAGVRKLLQEGGGEMNGSFVRAGLVDELSLLFTPVVDGGPGEPALFDVEDERLDEALTGLRLEHVSRVAADMLWVRYTVKNRRRRV